MGVVTAPIKAARGERRNVKITEILDVLLGMESKIFSLHRDMTGGEEGQHPMAHVSMTLVLIGSLPSMPGEDGALGRTKTAFEQRETLDLSFKDEEIFGLWVAALRALMSETEPVFFTKVAAPWNPVNASAIQSIRQKAPEDATCLELIRDAILLLLLSSFGTAMNIVWIICTAGAGTWWVTTLFGWYDCCYIIYGEGGYNATIDGPTWHMDKYDWANVAIQVVRGLLTYQCVFIVGPWRFTNLWHLTCSSRNSAPGLDLYGRSTDSVWFHIPEARRLKIILFLMGNIVFQICLQICACVYYSYALDKSAGGTITGLLFMLLSIGCAICGAVHQTNAEHDMHKQDPDKFPPNPVVHAIEKFQRQRNIKHARQSIAQEVEYMRSHRISMVDVGPDLPPPSGGYFDGSGNHVASRDVELHSRSAGESSILGRCGGTARSRVQEMRGDSGGSQSPRQQQVVSRKL
uniref:PH domain-containing protein n=1 Tax=Haptolina ericina TaxID=156174 RepID=A0A7S3ES02_9EUKA